MIEDKSIIRYYFDCLKLSDVERYKLTDGLRKIFSSKINDNARILNLEPKFEKDGLIEINEVLWSYKQGRGQKNILGDNSIFSNTKTNFKKLECINALQLHCSLTDKSDAGCLIRLYTINDERQN
ncbi:TPA: hypothetical protein ACGUW2_004222 [Vibrio vulnificus]